MSGDFTQSTTATASTMAATPVTLHVPNVRKQQSVSLSTAATQVLCARWISALLR